MQKALILISFLFFLEGCQSAPKLPTGIQEGYEAVNPAAILAVPTFVVPNPADPNSAIDHSILVSTPVVQKLEAKVIHSFSGQPNINGYPFTTVSKALGKTPPTIHDDLSMSLKNVVLRFSSRDTKTRLLITPRCLGRKNFIEFYSYCLAPDPSWIHNLNNLSAKILNADTALLVFLNNLQSNQTQGLYALSGGVAILLVDTNNGKLLWGNESFVTLNNPADKPYFPKWDDLTGALLPISFWKDFPGRLADEQKEKNK